MKHIKNSASFSFNPVKQDLGEGGITYTCTNHPAIILNEPGKCPECGKDLVKKY
ncbi:MAG: hypothetical protein M3R17_05055 [Bacteroidota bacterium]|nr:hypothetical protein [Bacteroidota bacterium]